MKNKFKIAIIVSLMFCTLFSISAFAEGWYADGANWKYIKEDGTFATNEFKFLKYGDSYNYAYYYFDENSNMCVGIKKIGNDYYSFNIDGTANSNSHVQIGETIYKTKNKGLMLDVFKAIDVDAYNAEFIAKNTKTAEQIAESEAAAAIAAEEKAAKEEIAAKEEKLGPKAKAHNVKDDGGPGVNLS